MSKNVVLGLDGSTDSVRAIPYATELAGEDGRIIAVHVREVLLGRAGDSPSPSMRTRSRPTSAARSRTSTHPA